MGQGVVFGIRLRWYAFNDGNYIPGEAGVEDVSVTSIDLLQEEIATFAAKALGNLLDRVEHGGGELCKLTVSIAVSPSEEAPLYERRRFN